MDALNAGRVRYLIAGGLAVVAHGHVRFAARFEVAPGTEAPFVGYRDLLQLKARAGRETDLDDIRRLEALHDEANE